MKKQSNEMAHAKALNAIQQARHKSEAWINANLHLVEFPALQLYARGTDVRWWASNDSLLGLRFMDWEYRFAACPPAHATRLGETSELSDRAIAVLHDHMLEHWNSKESKRLQGVMGSISDLMTGKAKASSHSAVKAITTIANSL